MFELDGTESLDRRLADALERLGHGMRSLAQRSSQAHGLTPLQQQIVLALARQPAERREVKALAAEFDVTSPTLSDAVTALERKGVVTRTPGADGRRRLLTLTTDGTALAGDLVAWSGPLLDALESVSVGDKAAMLAALLGVIANLQASGVISVARTCTTCRFFQQDARNRMRCGLLQAPLRRDQLRTDCPEHQLADA